MKVLAPAALILVVVLLVPLVLVRGTGSTGYTLQIGSDGSALWMVTQTLGINSSFETLETLQARITSLVKASENATGRSMSATADSLAFTQISPSYIEAQYKFIWENFGQLEDSRIVVGDVFRTAGFFDRLYGDGSVQVMYPSQYGVESAEPVPYVRNDSIQTLEWLGTKDLQEGTTIVLTQESGSSSFVDVLRANAVLVAGIVAAAAVCSVALFGFSRTRKKKIRTSEEGDIKLLSALENDEERTVKLIRSSGGSVHQSSIKDQLGFSKAKTSQLLAVLERKGTIMRYKKGRDKIVVLKEKGKGEDS
jgi:uncharacterized membrane protein